MGSWREWHLTRLAEIQKKYDEIKEGGGKKKHEELRKKGKLPVRERIARLLDEGSPFLEIGAFAGYGMYEEYGGAPAGGTIVGLGYVSGRLCVIVANDPSVKAGAWFPITAKKNLRAQEIAMVNRIPIIYLVDSAGVFLPLQSEVFPDKEHFGRIFRNNAIMSRMGIPQVAAIMGSCVAGGAYLPIMSDEALIVEGTGTLFLAGPYLVRAAIGEKVDEQTLGGAWVHCAISGNTDYYCKSDEEAIEKIRSIISYMGESPKAGFNRTSSVPPKMNPEEIFDILPPDRSKPYDMREIILRLVDNSYFEEYKAEYGKTILCGYARIDGWAVGIVANQRLIVKNGRNEMQFGGVIYSDSADKAARFIMICNERKIPLLFLQDVTGFMVGTRAEHGGIIKDGAKMVNAVANSVVPKFTIIVGNSFGAGNYAMCGKAYDPRLILGWHTATIAVMGGEQAASTLLQIELAKRKGEISEKEKQALFEKIKKKYESEMTPEFAAARLWIDAIISPLETRQWISIGIEMANHAPIEEPFSTGILQT